MTLVSSHISIYAATKTARWWGGDRHCQVHCITHTKIDGINTTLQNMRGGEGRKERGGRKERRREEGQVGGERMSEGRGGREERGGEDEEGE